MLVVPAGIEPATFRVGACRHQSDRRALDAVERGGAAIRPGYGECFIVVVAAGIAGRHSSRLPFPTGTMTNLGIDVRRLCLGPNRVRIGRNWHYSRRMALEWAESFGMSIDWERAKAEAKRERAQLALKEADAELAELSFAAMNDLQAWDSGPYRSITHGRKILMISATPNRRN